MQSKEHLQCYKYITPYFKVFVYLSSAPSVYVDPPHFITCNKLSNSLNMKYWFCFSIYRRNKSMKSRKWTNFIEKIASVFQLKCKNIFIYYNAEQV